MLTEPEAAAQPLRSAGTIANVRVVGNQRIEEGTVRSYMLVQPGDVFDPERIDRSLKALYATGLFSDVKLTRQGNTLVVTLVENPVVNRVAFEGNHKLNDDALRPEVQLRPRAVFTPAIALADRQRILDLYARKGRFDARVEPKVIKLDQNRVDVVFEIHDGDSTLISRISFIGNHAYGEGTLREVVSSREGRWWRILSTSDNYDPERIAYDRELLRRYYFRHGYADFDVIGANSELAPDKSGFFVTYTVREGERFRIAKVDINSSLRNVTAESLRGDVEIDPGDWYDGDAVDRVTQALIQAVQDRGIAFVDVKPQIKRNEADHTIDLTFDVIEGPRVYVERIDIVGNTRTMDKVIRREFRLAEGDPSNAALARRSRQRLQDLNYFSSVDIVPSPGSAPDKAILTTTVQEKATGELSLGGGYSTDVGPLVTAGLRERNLVGTGIDAALTGMLAQKESQINFSLTDPYFLDQNIVSGFDLFHVQNNLQSIAGYNESRTGQAERIGYEFTEHLRQLWTYTLSTRNIYGIQPGASVYVTNQAGQSTLSQLGQTMTLDYRDSRLSPHEGFVLRGGTDFAGIGGTTKFIKLLSTGAYFVPLDRFTGNSDWMISFSGSLGYLFNLGQQEYIVDRFFLGGDNLRGFQVAGAGPHSTGANTASGQAYSIGGRFLWTQSSELHFPLPISPDLGLSGRTFVDIGALSQVNTLYVNGSAVPIVDYAGPRVGVGIGVSWNTPFGLLNLDLAKAVVKYNYDRTELFRFGFGTKF